MMNWTGARRKPRSGLLGVLGLLAVCSAASRADAQPASARGPIRAHLVVEADAGCATRQALAARVRARSRRVRFVDRAADVPRLVVEIVTRAPGQHAARFEIAWPDGQHAERSLTAQSCDSALDALSLLLAMTLDPTSAERTEPPPPAPSRDADAGQDAPPPAPREVRAAEPTAPTSEPETSTGDDDTGRTGDAAQATGGEEATTPDAGIDERAPSVEAPALAHAHGDDAERDRHPLGVDHLAVGVSGQLAWEVAPEALVGLGVYARLAMAGSGAWTPALELRLHHAWASDLALAGGRADFQLDSAELSACPLGLRLGPLDARACLDGSVGRVRAVGSETYSPQAHRKLWGSVGAGALLSLAIGRFVEVHAGFHLAAPLSRYGFAFRPEVFHRVPAVVFHGHLGAGVRFP